MGRIAIACCALLAVLMSGTAQARNQPTRLAHRPVVVAVMEPGGFNVLHQEFRTKDGRDPTLPAGMPASTAVSLPSKGTFSQRLAKAEAGELGSLTPGRLYRIAGTRIIGLLAGPGNLSDVDTFTDAGHGTGVAGARFYLPQGTGARALWGDRNALLG